MGFARLSGALLVVMLSGSVTVTAASPSPAPAVAPADRQATGDAVASLLGTGSALAVLPLSPVMGVELASLVSGSGRYPGVFLAAHDLGDDAADASAGPDPGRRPRPSDQRTLHLVRTISGGLTPKSIVGTPSGRFFAQNVTYLHTIAVFDRRFRRIATISDVVRRSWLRQGGDRVKVHGAPVEAAVSTDGDTIYVSQYSMYGPGFTSPGFDLCAEADAIDESYVYRIDVETLRMVRAYRVGEVPKFLAASPDGRHLLVANWCSMDVSVVDLVRAKEVTRIPVGLNPRGIAFSPDGSEAWVSVVGERRLVVIDVARRKVRRSIDGVGIRPRHLVMSPGGHALYVAVEGYEVTGRRDGSVLKLDPHTGASLGRVDGLLEPRTMVLAPDGRSLYVVDYLAGRLVKIDTSTMRILQSVPLGYHPIGVTYDATTAHVWVAGYGGSIWVLKDRPRSTRARAG